MRFAPLLPIAALAALAAGAAAAQTSTSGGMNDQSTPTAPSAAQAATPASASIGAGGVTSSPTPADDAYKLKAGDPTVVSNNPIPDTPANRRLYGGPMSNGGRHTAASGD
ncbi:MAG TPA: hypothetical protein VN805_03335 [Caulobacteraceae bacterium]|nr:hypothetical protein [Caulobacteraceae bacterium]